MGMHVIRKPCNVHMFLLVTRSTPPLNWLQTTEREREIVCECVPFWKVVFIFCVLDFMCAGSHVNLDFEFDFQIAGSSSSSNNWNGRKGRRFQPMLFVSHICVPMCAWINLPNSIPFNIIICVSIYIFMHLECLRWHLMTTGNNIDLIG